MASAFRRQLMKSLRGLQVFMYRLSKGRIGGSINGSPLLLLTVKGRKSGTPYTIPLAYVRHHGEYLISASAAGADKDPVWLSNLKSRGEAQIEVNGAVYPVKPTVTTGEERDRLYALFKVQGQNFVEYEKKTTRKIPVVRLQPQ
jgi:deazaflavin-dependent oxidoreductase (nitroreductase family)